MSIRWGGTADDVVLDANGNVVSSRRVRFWTARSGSAPSGSEFTALFSDDTLTTSVGSVLTDSQGRWGAVYTADTVTALYAGAEALVGGVPSAPTTVTELVPRSVLTVAAASGTYVAQTSFGYVVTPTGVAATDTAAVHAARDLAGIGGRVIIGPGELLTTGLTLDKAGQVWDIHPDAVIKLANGANVDVINVTGAGARVIGDGTINGNKTNQTANGRGVTSRVNGVQVRDVTVVDTYHAGVYNLGGSRFRAQDVTVTGSGYIGIFSEPNGAPYEDVKVIGCHVDRSALAAASISEGGIKVKGNSNVNTLRGAAVRGCTVRMPVSPTDGTAICIETTYCPSAVVNDNQTFDGAMGVSAAACDRVAVGDNTVYNAKSYGIEGAGCRNGTFTGNTVDGNGLTAQGIILSTGDGNTSDGATIGNNTVYLCTTTGIRNQTGKRVSIAGNTVYLTAADAYCIYLSAADGSTLAGNTVDGAGTAAKGVMVEASSDISIAGGSVRNFTQHGVLLYATSAVTMNNIAISGVVFKSTTSPVGTQLSGGAVLGSNVRVTGCPGFTPVGAVAGDWLDMLGQAAFAVGTASPEGTVFAGPGSLYLRQSGGSSTLWVKRSAIDTNTGWVALVLDGVATPGKLLTTGGIGVGNSAAATTLGAVTKKVQVFDAAGASIGYVPVYDAIT